MVVVWAMVAVMALVKVVVEREGGRLGGGLLGFQDVSFS